MSKSPRPPAGRAAARELCEPSAQDRQRIRESLDRAIAGGGASPTVLRVEASMAKRALGVPETTGLWGGKAGLGKLLVPTLLIGAGLGALWNAQQDPAPSVASDASLPLHVEDLADNDGDPPALAQPSAAGSPHWAAPVTAPSAKHATHPHAHHHAVHKPTAPSAPAPEPVLADEPAFEPPQAAPPASHHLAEELRLMRAASAALTDDEPGKALQVLRDHARRFPDGALAQERRALRAIGLCKQRAPEARRERDAFLNSDAQSPLAARVREACEPKP